LPNACETKIIVTMNARELLHFFELRCCFRAQWEIREVAWEMFRLVYKVAPNIFSLGGPSCINRTCNEGKMSCGRSVEAKKRFWEKMSCGRSVRIKETFFGDDKWTVMI